MVNIQFMVSCVIYIFQKVLKVMILLLPSDDLFDEMFIQAEIYYSFLDIFIELS